MKRRGVRRVATAAVLSAFAAFAAPTRGAEPATLVDADADSVAREFARRLAAAMVGGPIPMDRLFAPVGRDSSLRILEARSNALFTWSGLRVEAEPGAARRVSPPAGEASAEVIDCILRVAGTATWDPQAYGVAVSLWRPLHDEAREVNRVARREAWRLERTSDGWLARERVTLSPFHVRRLAVRAGVFPAQDVLLVESTFSLVADLGGVDVARFFLDRRAQIYDQFVNDVRVEPTRGSELGSLGLEGFSPELESSFRLPRALDRGEEILVKFRTRSPLVHLEGPGFVTTLPLHTSTFRERAWIPIFGAEPESEARASEVVLTVVWPKGAFERVLLSGQAARANAAAFPEEDGASSTGNAARSPDFVLFAKDATADDAFDVLRGVRGADPRIAGVYGIEWEGGAASWEPFATPARDALDPHPRSRRALVVPLAEISMTSSRDLSSELQDALPLDAELLDELFDDSATDAERSGDDRSVE